MIYTYYYEIYGASKDNDIHYGLDGYLLCDGSIAKTPHIEQLYKVGCRHCYNVLNDLYNSKYYYSMATDGIWFHDNRFIEGRVNINMDINIEIHLFPNQHLPIKRLQDKEDWIDDYQSIQEFLKEEVKKQNITDLSINEKYPLNSKLWIDAFMCEVF